MKHNVHDQRVIIHTTDNWKITASFQRAPLITVNT